MFYFLSYTNFHTISILCKNIDGELFGRMIYREFLNTGNISKDIEFEKFKRTHPYYYCLNIRV